MCGSGGRICEVSRSPGCGAVSFRTVWASGNQRSRRCGYLGTPRIKRRGLQRLRELSRAHSASADPSLLPSVSLLSRSVPQASQARAASGPLQPPLPVTGGLHSLWGLSTPLPRPAYPKTSPSAFSAIFFIPLVNFRKSHEFVFQFISVFFTRQGTP